MPNGRLVDVELCVDDPISLIFEKVQPHMDRIAAEKKLEEARTLLAAAETEIARLTAENEPETAITGSEEPDGKEGAVLSRRSKRLRKEEPDEVDEGIVARRRRRI